MPQDMRYLTQLLTGKGPEKEVLFSPMTPQQQQKHTNLLAAVEAKPMSALEALGGVAGGADEISPQQNESGSAMEQLILSMAQPQQVSPEASATKSKFSDYLTSYNTAQDEAIEKNREIIDQYNQREQAPDLSGIAKLADIWSGRGDVYSKAYQAPPSSEEQLKLKLAMADKMADIEKDRMSTNVSALKALAEGGPSSFDQWRALSFLKSANAQERRAKASEETRDLNAHQKHLTQVSNRPEVENTRKFFNVINDSVKTFANPKREFTPQSFEELQQNIIGAVRGMSGQSGVHEREAQKVVDQLNVGWPAFKQKWLGAGPVDLRKNPEARAFINHFLNQAKIEMDNLKSRFTKVLLAKSKGMGSFYKRRTDLAGDLLERLEGEAGTVDPTESSKIVEKFTEEDDLGSLEELYESL